MRRALLMLLALAAPAFAKERPVPACAGPIKPPLFISPMGEPYRPSGDGDDPERRWFEQADRDHDGRLTIGEMMLDADRFFAVLDKDHDGELLPDEVHGYEENVAPEVRLYQRRPDRDADAADRPRDEDDPQNESRKRSRRGGGLGADGTMGAGRYSFLNIPNPVASADDDINRAVDRKEFEQAAAQRFRDLDPEQSKALTLAMLPKTPAQVAANRACLANRQGAGREKRL